MSFALAQNIFTRPGPSRWLVIMLITFAAVFVMHGVAQTDSAYGDFTDVANKNPDRQPVSLGVVSEFTASIPMFFNAVFGKDFLERVVGIALKMAAGLTQVALVLAGALSLASGIWQVMIATLEKKGVQSILVETFLFLSVTAFLIGSYELLVNQVLEVAKMGMLAAGQSPGDAFYTFLRAIFTPFGMIWNGVINGTGGMFSVGIGSGILGSLIVIALLIYAVISLLGASKEILGVFIMGPFFLGVGIVFGPLMLATIASSWTRKWFEQWINFLVGSAFLTVVASVLLVLVAGVLREIGFGEKMGAMQSIGAALAIAIMADGLAKLFSAVPAMTDAIFPGRTGAGAGIQSNMAGTVMGSLAAGAVGGAVAGSVGVAAAKAAGVSGANAAVVMGRQMMSGVMDVLKGKGAVDIAAGAKEAVQSGVADAKERTRYDNWHQSRP